MKDAFDKTLFIRYFVPICLLLTMGSWFLGLGPGGLAGSILLSGLITALAMHVTDGFGSRVANRLYGTGRTRRSIEDLTAADMARARALRLEGDYVHALAAVEQVLAGAPEYPAAVFLQAEILWDGFRKKPEAVNALLEVIRITGEGDKVRGWALALLEEINQPS